MNRQCPLCGKVFRMNDLVTDVKKVMSVPGLNGVMVVEAVPIFQVAHLKCPEEKPPKGAKKTPTVR